MPDVKPPKHFDLYCRDLDEKADGVARATEARILACEIRAFHAGRLWQLEMDDRKQFWLRVRWLLLGCLLGGSLVAGYVQLFQGEAILRSLTR